ncbi:phosphotransferase RcsD [Yersinia enterocolitica]|uniref:Phosphotransferase RcsD n=1 Tax=Yersinia enterocolitica serotype O:8 / biotype 1B (strain NCTC 13174 / 8081) TaxID=393305 RepID=A1JLC2_YERE8|nr:phosphotransferase RcsD [Yersinia enterocolitica]AJJ22849.1 hpt domain protein [Yersinia enterocolitica]CAL11490.1 putative two component sensor kinase [Yersinia enterocolitica subsp. enterocolitica 8081]HDL8282833.1 phosphotransferase RcsD [Yersinia enterocolitica]HDM8290920.1 phosphotransferase RcsD [Yersinia enterocolitica]HDM8294971.1 phosphotransferase RcsD [Yersinia enterocolitica]
MQNNSLSTSSANITRCFWLFIVLLLITVGLYGYNYTNAYLTEKKHALSYIATGLQQRIEDYRYHTYQIYDFANNPNISDKNILSAQEVRLRPDIYYIEKPRRKTDAVIFGNHEPATLAMTLQLSDYLDSHWGAQNDTYSMYYLNGQDNSLTLITTQALKEVTSRFKESYLTAAAESRRAEMLQQANTLDERESFSPLRKLRFQNAYYFTIRTTFNHPGHLATVIAFDLPINDLIPPNMARSNFLLQPDKTPINEGMAPEDTAAASVTLNGYWVEISAPLANTSLKIVYRVPVTVLAIDLLRNNFWLILSNILLLALAVLGIYFIRRQFVRPSTDMLDQLEAQKSLSQEIITSLPQGLLVYNFSSNVVVASNQIADNLMPHLNLQKIAHMAEQHHGVIQGTVNNEVYEIRMFRSKFSPETYLFLLHDQDKEVLVNKRLQQARREYDKSLQARKLMLHNLGIELNQPINNLNQTAKELQNTTDPAVQHELARKLAEQSESIIELIDNITLLTRLETQDWQPEQHSFSLSALIDGLLLDVLPAINQKGLTLFNHYLVGLDQNYIGDEKVLRKILSLLLHYSVITTAYGKITLNVDHEPGHPEQLIIQITDTGVGISDEEISNLNYPFLSQTLADRYNHSSGLTFFLCNQLCKKLNGQLEIRSKVDIGTRYTIRVTIAIQNEQEEEQEKLLDGVTVLLDITSEEVRSIITTLLNSFGANCIIVDDRLPGRDYDVMVTDNPQHYDNYTLLLASDEPGMQQLQDNYIRVNYNLGSAVIDAILLLIEQQISSDEHIEKPESIAADDINAYEQQLKSSDYYSLFVETVPVDLKKLYTELQQRDFISLSQTAHRLKGVFAMLNLLIGKQLCETLEQHIADGDRLKIENSISQIDSFVTRLLQQGNP